MSNRNYILDGMMGLVVGDALGCPVQFLSRERIWNRGLVTGMEGYGTYNMPVGTWTDDGSMALATLASINEKDNIVLEDIMQRFMDWEFHGDYTPFGEAFDEGNTCSMAIHHYAKNKNVQTCGRTGEYANGNGALMRILPVCLYYINLQNQLGVLDDEAIRDIHNVTSLTHNHLRSHMASGLYYFMAKAIVKEKEADRKLCENMDIKKCLQQGLDEGFHFYRQNFVHLTEMRHFKRLFHLDKFKNVQETEIRSSGYVLDTIEAVIWCLITTDTFESCLLKAVNLGDDTDTVAAIAGGLAGLYYGYESMPKEWLAAIQKREWIEEMCSGRTWKEGEIHQ
ncbi:MAG: ADP-ribosylglycohydrolase family protein [Lachnospiraceae bacterium]|nr:ADP-ribosylglycohydrolase family protein [Lachnospiraceae bacterium]